MAVPASTIGSMIFLLSHPASAQFQPLLPLPSSHCERPFRCLARILALVCSFRFLLTWRPSSQGYGPLSVLCLLPVANCLLTPLRHRGHSKGGEIDAEKDWKRIQDYSLLVLLINIYHFSARSTLRCLQNSHIVVI